MTTWEQIYEVFGVADFIYFITSPAIQDQLFGVKLVFFFCAVIYFYLNSSYLHYQFLQDTTEFLSWEAYGLVEINRRFKKITKRLAQGTENDYKLAIIEADEFLYQTMENNGYEGKTFEELANAAGKKLLPEFEDILDAHAVRNAIVYDSGYILDIPKAKKIMADYENAIKNISISSPGPGKKLNYWNSPVPTVPST